ncbi:MAG: PD-(D/E)XK nuclease family protein [Thermodesulfobacteriota bacterium]
MKTGTLKTAVFTEPLCGGGVFESLGIKPAADGDLLVLPDIPAVMQARKLFRGMDSVRFITTFGALARAHNTRAGRKRILSRTGRMILMRRAIESAGKADENRTRTALELLASCAGLKQNGITARILSEKVKEKLPPETARKLAGIAPVIGEFEKRMEQSGMVDDTDVISAFAGAVANGSEGGISGRVKRIVAAGFHRLTPLHVSILREAEAAGISALVATPAESGGGKTDISICQFASVTAEAEFAAGEIRRMADGGRAIEDFAVIVRNLKSSGAVIRDVFERNGIPVNVQSERLGAASGISVLIKNLLETARLGFADGQFIRLIRNPMLKKFVGARGLEAAELMERRIEQIGKREEPGDGFESVTDTLRDKPELKGALAKITELRRMLSEGLGAGGEPPSESAVFSALRSIIDKTGAFEAAGADPSVEKAREFLREAEFFCGKWDAKISSRKEFSEFVSELLNGKTYSRKTGGGGRVPVMNALQSRGTSYPVVFVLDCGERSFPARKAESLVFNDGEKDIINRHCGAEAFATADNYLSDERLIWHSVLACASGKLFVSYSRGATRGAEGRSHFIEELKEARAVTERETGGADIPSNPYCAETVMADALLREGKIPEKTAKLLAPADPFFKLAQAAADGGVKAEKERLRPEGDFGRFEGMAGEGIEKQRLKGLSVTGVEKMGRCPFMFFCANTLGIREKPHGETVPSPAETGGLYHAALKHLFSSEHPETLIKSPEKVSELLGGFIDDPETRRRFCRVEERVWKLQKERAFFTLEHFAQIELGRIVSFVSKPEFFEEEVVVNIGGAKLKGRLDRMDTSPDGVSVYDYKKGAVKGVFCDRSKLQVPLYVDSIASREGKKTNIGAYLSVENPGEMNAAGITGEKGIQEVPVKKAKLLALKNIELVKKGFFAPVPTRKDGEFPYGEKPVILKKDAPCGFCPYSDICRIKDGAARKVEDGKDS